MFKKLNMQLNEVVNVCTNTMAWQPSPAVGVERRQLEREAIESGRTTSVVRYAPGSHFPRHIHHGGEEFLVLEGIFSDEYGDYPKGTYVRNPTQSQHAPYTKLGCTIFVKLCQFHENDKNRMVIDVHKEQWLEGDSYGVHVQTLHKFHNELVQLQKWAANTSLAEKCFTHGIEVFVIEGEVQLMGETYGKGCWMRRPAGSVLSMRSNDGCLLYTKQGHL